MLADDCWLEVVRYQNRYSLDVLSLVSVASQKKILTDKCIASFRRTLVNVSYRNDDWFMEGPDGRTLTFIDIHHASFQERQASESSIGTALSSSYIVTFDIGSVSMPRSLLYILGGIVPTSTIGTLTFSEQMNYIAFARVDCVFIQTVLSSFNSVNNLHLLLPVDGAIFNDDLLRHLTLRRVKSLLIGSRSNPWDVFELSTDAIVEFLYKPGGGSLVVQSGWVNAGNVFLEAMLEKRTSAGTDDQVHAWLDSDLIGLRAFSDLADYAEFGPQKDIVSFRDSKLTFSLLKRPQALRKRILCVQST